MALLEAVKREASQILHKLGLGDQNMMAANFRAHGAEMGFYDFEDYVKYAERIYREAMANPDGFTIIDLPRKRKAVDFQGKLRGVYNQFGEPMAFFKPDYQKLGYSSAQEELREFRSAVLTASS